jgi:hypothetical protein
VSSPSQKIPKPRRKKESNKDEVIIPLKIRAKDFFKRKNLSKNLKTEEDVTMYGTSGAEYEVDFLLTTEQPSNCQRVAVIVKDYKGPAKVTNIHQAAHLQNDCTEVDKVLLVSNKISGPAKNLAKRSGIQTLSRDEIQAILDEKGND